jgi:CheY-like chemotaxis protein
MIVRREVNLITKTILLIDDEANVREVVELCLKDLAGWNVVMTSPLAGLKIAESEYIDAIVLDLSIRDLDILKFLNKLRNNPKTQIIPVILLSAKARWLDTQILRQYKVTGVIPKPFDPVTLPIKVSKILGWNLTLV